jgi:hypothetical protein
MDVTRTIGAADENFTLRLAQGGGEKLASYVGALPDTPAAVPIRATGDE